MSSLQIFDTLLSLREFSGDHRSECPLRVKADIATVNFDVRFHPESCHDIDQAGCPLMTMLSKKVLI
jgi:hypothetical protein